MKKKFKIKSITKSDVKNGKGTKDDKGKIDLTLLDPYWEEEVALVLEVGQIKYKRGNWQLDLEPKRILAALKRHTNQISKGEIFDKESGCRHSAHIACNSMFLNYYERHGKTINLEHDKGWK